jgi:hypothetical protein
MHLVIVSEMLVLTRFRANKQLTKNKGHCSSKVAHVVAKLRDVVDCRRSLFSLDDDRPFMPIN